MKLTGTIYTTNKKKFISDTLPGIKFYIKKAKGLTIGTFTIKEIELDIPNVPIVPVTKSDGTKYTNLDWDWQTEQFPAEGNFSCLHISKKERNALGLLHNSGRNTLGGRYNRDIGDSSMEFLVIADRAADFIRIFLHELSHGCSHWTGVVDQTHSFEAGHNFIGDIYSQHDFTRWNELNEKVTTLTKKRDDLLVKKTK